jgi:FkbM family methyltransferase
MSKPLQNLSLKLKAFKSFLRGRLLKLFGVRAAGVFVDAPWGFMLIDPRDGHVSRQFLRNGCYNPQEVEHLTSLLKPTDRLLIVGGHIGGVAIPLSKKVRTVDVIEASPNNHKLLTANLLLAGCNNVSIHHWAASDSNGQLEFLMSSENSGGSKRAPAQRNANYLYDKPQSIQVPAHRLDDVFNEKFDAVLMDIEGSEYFAIRGGKRLLSECRVFIFEFIPDHLENVAGVNLDDFLAALPTDNFSDAKLPRCGKSFPVSELRRELQRICEKNDYEDGVVLTR